jgi:HK97 family phage portal protein
MAINILKPISRAFAALKVRLSDPQRSGHGYHFGRNNAGVHVTHEIAEQVAAVWACMDVIASAMSSSDWNVYGGARGQNKKQDLPDDNLQYILNTRFNPEMTAQAGKRALLLAGVGYGTGYAEIERDMAGRIVALWPIAPNRVDPRRHLDTGRLFYRVTQDMGGGWVDMDPEDLFIIRGASLTGVAGDDTVSRAIQTIATAVALDQYAAGFFGNGAQLGTIFTYKGKLGEEQFDRIREQIDQRYGGVKNAFRTGIIDGSNEWGIHQLGIDAEKSQLVNVKHLSVEEICRWFRVPPHKIAHLLRATNNNIEHQGLEFSRDTLRPWKKEIEQEADYKLIAYRGPKKFIEIDVDWAEQGDYKSRMEAYAAGINCGVFSPNVVLAKLGENTIGAEGDIRFVNGAAIPLDRIGDAYQQKSLPATAPGGEGSSTVTKAWLASVYARIQRRYENRAAALEKSGSRDWMHQARQDAYPYASQHVEEMGEALGNRLAAAQKWAVEVVNGCDPAIAAECAMKEEIQ